MSGNGQPALRQFSGKGLRYALVVGAIAVCCLRAIAPASAAVIYVRHHAGPADGTSWATAFDKVQDAVDAAVGGDEIWVAEGTYAENITLKNAVALYGGFVGTETQRTQRDWRIRITILDGNRAGSVIDVAKDVTPSTRVDGFTITNGMAVLGGGIYCNYGADPVIANNIIVNNSAANEGGGIYCNTDSGPTIANNRILANAATAAGGGIRTTAGATTIADNLVVSNSALSGGGICCGNTSTVSHEVISNNTVFANTANSGGGIYCLGNSAASIANTIVAFNASGIRKDSGSGTVNLRYNCVYGNMYSDYSGLSQGSNDIVIDPLFASGKYGNLHIQPSSPCKEAGNNSYVVGSYPDMDGQTRILGTVDIGADESDGTVWLVIPRIVRVTPNGNDANDGSGWDVGHAKVSIQAAIDAAAQVGGEVWVMAGTYLGRITLRDFVYVYGGFAGTETSVSQRNWKGNTTAINAYPAGSAVTARFLGHRISAVDGFRIVNGNAYNGGGICCESASPFIANNTITGNTADNKGGGIYLNNSSASVTGNTILGNSALTSGGGIFADRACAEIFGNSIDGNSASINGCGMAFSSDNATRAVSNKILRNAEEATLGDAWGGGVSLACYGTPSITNNTVIYNSASYSGIYCSPFGTLSLSSNLIGFNSAGIWADEASSTSGVRNNCLYGNTGYNYLGFAGGTGDISANPLFIAPWLEDYRVRQSSPCIDAGYDSAVQAAWTDFDGNPRKMGLHVDIGSFEWNGVANLSQKINHARAFPEGVPVELRGKPISAEFDGAFYIEECDRSSGLRILSSEDVTPGYFATVIGQMTLDNGERSLSATSVSTTLGSPEDIPVALLCTNRALGGGDYLYNQGGESTGQQGITGASGLNSIGLRVTIVGRVVEKDTSLPPTWLRVDDGSQVMDDSGLQGVKVLAEGLSLPDVGSHVQVTGISSCFKVGSNLYRQIRATEVTALD